MRGARIIQLLPDRYLVRVMFSCTPVGACLLVGGTPLRQSRKPTVNELLSCQHSIDPNSVSVL